MFTISRRALGASLPILALSAASVLAFYLMSQVGAGPGSTSV